MEGLFQFGLKNKKKEVAEAINSSIMEKFKNLKSSGQQNQIKNLGQLNILKKQQFGIRTKVAVTFDDETIDKESDE